MGVMPMPIPPIYEPELGAQAILHAAQGNERNVFVGGAGKLIPPSTPRSSTRPKRRWG